MQRIGFQRLTVVFRRDASEGAGAPGVDCDGQQHNQKRGDTRFNFHAVEEQPLDRFINDPDASQQQQTGFDEGGKILELAVPVLVIGVGRLVGNPHRKKSHQRRDQIQSGVRSFRQNSQRAGGDPDNNFQAGDHQSSQHRVPGNCPFLPPHGLGTVGGLNFGHQRHYRFGFARRQPLGPLARFPGGHATMTFVAISPWRILIDAFPVPRISLAHQPGLRTSAGASRSSRRRSPDGTKRSRRVPRS